MSDTRWDYIFLFSNEPVPSLIEKVQCAVAAGRRVVVMYLSRPWTPVQMGTISNADVFRVPVDFRAVGLRRSLQFFKIMRWLRRHVFANATPGCDVYTDSIDLLALAQIVGGRRGRVYRFDVRDLHPLQLNDGPLARIVQAVERILLRRVSVLVLTSRAHYDRYYHSRFSGTTTYVENVPARRPWVGFRRATTNRFVVGFIGVLRYRKPLETLIAAVRQLNENGMPVYLRIAGGGVVEDLRTIAGQVPYVEFEGPFRYDDAVQRLFGDLAVINSVYDACDSNVRLAVSNKFYEAQIAGIPVMVASGTHVADLVEAAGVGTAVRHDDVGAVAAAIADAYHGRGWYRSALARLETIDVETLFVRHDAETRVAVLGLPGCDSDVLDSKV